MAKKTPTDNGAEPGQEWTETTTGEKVVVLHVGSTHVLVQKPNHVGRFPHEDFGVTFTQKGKS